MEITTHKFTGLGVPEGRLVPAGEHEIWMCELGAGGRPTVFLHGGGPGCTGWVDFRPVVPEFIGDRRIVLVDLLGFGLSSEIRNRSPRWSFQADRLAAALDAVSIGPADFVCSSIGGSVALALAAKRPDLVRKIVISGSQPMDRDAVAASPERKLEGQQAWSKYWAGEGPTREKARHIMASLEWWDPSGIPDDTVELRYQYSLEPGQRAVGEDFGNLGAPEDLESLFSAIQARVLCLWGMDDPFLVVEYALSLARSLPYADVHVMSESSHHMFEERPKDYARIVKAFLDSPQDSKE
jgi:pimeloyl-ACP methyl ester carboxylesterase